MGFTGTLDGLRLHSPVLMMKTLSVLYTVLHHNPVNEILQSVTDYDTDKLRSCDKNTLVIFVLLVG